MAQHDIMSFMFNFFWNTTIPEITAEEIKKMITDKQSITVVDVRTQGEYVKGHIPGSISVPLDELEKIS